MPEPTPGSLQPSRTGRERTVAATATIPAPPEAVWDLVSDPERFPDWADRTLEVTRADRPLSIGSTYEERNVVLGPLTGTSRWTVVEHEPPLRSTHRGEGIALAAALDFFVELRPVEQATELTVGLRYRPGLGPLGALIDRVHSRRSLQESMQRTVANVASIAERELPARAAAR
jgi:carbon monoxide dehydrogenase subunit G